MQGQRGEIRENVLKRFLWLYGLHSLLHMISFLAGYYLLPEGFMRGSPQFAVGSLTASANSFWEEFALTLLFNLGVVFSICALSNLQRMYGMPAGYFVNVLLAVTSGLVSGTNSFAASDLRQFNALDGAALGMSIGGIEMTAYVLAISATAGIGIYDYTLREWKGIKIKNWREIRLSGTEIFCLCLGVLLLVVAAYRETVMALNV
ncbi:MAG: hypothetical protein ACOYVE_14615 [Melioribacter sp.]|uniref:hypothetical protein n=1 Tax=Melioribacter sp. TaxID=2052167 RepID=UPI003BD8150E